MPEDPIDSGGRHLDPEEFAKEVAQRLAATEPKSKRRPARKSKEEKRVDRGSKPVTPFLGRLVSLAVIVGLCFGIGIAIAATVVWATGSLPGSAAEPTIPPTVTFPGQVTTTVQEPMTTVVGDTTTTTSAAPEATTTTDASSSTMGTTTPQPTTTTRPPTTTTPPPTTTSTTSPATTTTTAPLPTGTITCNGGPCSGSFSGPVTIVFTCQNASTCAGQWRPPGEESWLLIPGEAGQEQSTGYQAGTWHVRVRANGTTTVAGPFTFTMN